jgi:hypothetical protein
VVVETQEEHRRDEGIAGRVLHAASRWRDRVRIASWMLHRGRAPVARAQCQLPDGRRLHATHSA